MLLMTVVYSICAQPISSQDEYLSDLNVDTAVAVREKQVDKHDKDGNVVSSVFFSRKKHRWVKSEKSEYTYDESGSLRSNTSYRWLDSNWIEIEKYEYTRDSAGHLTSTVVYAWSNGGWIGDHKYERSYDGVESSREMSK